MSSEDEKTKTGTMRPPYDEAFKRAAVAQWQSGVPASRVAENLGITTESLRTWRRQFAGVDTLPATGKLPAVAPTTQKLAAEVRRLRAQLQSVTNQRDISKRPWASLPAQTGAFLPCLQPRQMPTPSAIRARPWRCREQASTPGENVGRAPGRGLTRHSASRSARSLPAAGAPAAPWLPCGAATTLRGIWTAKAVGKAWRSEIAIHLGVQSKECSTMQPTNS